MANSDWASEAFGPLHGETRSEKDRADIVSEFANDFAVLELSDELELVDGCETCFRWVFGSGLQCVVHSDELQHLRDEGYGSHEQ